MMSWYAIYTKPKAEDSVTQLIGDAGIAIFNPKIKTKKYVRKKYSEVIEQFFPCYIFAFIDIEQYGHMIRYTRGVRYIVGKEHPLIVPPEIIGTIKERMEDGIVKQPSERFISGDKVLIKEGPFKDFYGIFERDISGRERALILLEALQSRLEIEMLSIKKA
jgi:transcriptional antiterminator RfaH